jgi:predicted nucleic acid-binding protein
MLDIHQTREELEELATAADHIARTGQVYISERAVDFWKRKAEFLRGAEIAGHDRQAIRDFLKRFPTVWPDEYTLEIYASLYSSLKKRNELIGPNDLWIAASALQNSVPLVSKNKIEFQRVPGLRLEGY